MELQDVTFANAVGFPIFRVEPISVIRQHLEQKPEPAQPGFTTEPVTVYPGDKNHLPYDVVVQTLRTNEPEPPAPAAEPEKTLDEVLKAGWDVGVAWQDGRPFHGCCHIRMNLALPLTRVQEAFARLKTYVFTIEK